MEHIDKDIITKNEYLVLCGLKYLVVKHDDRLTELYDTIGEIIGEDPASYSGWSLEFQYREVDDILSTLEIEVEES